jgi:hypothetical protein
MTVGKKRQKKSEKRKSRISSPWQNQPKKRQQHKSLTGSGNTDATFTDEK